MHMPRFGSGYGPAAAGLHLRWRHLAAMIVLLAATAVVLSAFGRPWWCKAGDARLWSGDIWSRHNSQHLVDPYTVTHALHGLALYGVLWLFLGRLVRPIGRAALGIAIETAWEVIENTDAMIERYRAATISLDYYGDSVANSLGDVIAFAVGYLGATVLPASVSVVGFFVVDGMLVLWIRDSLLLNVLMLLYPVEWVKAWQMGRAG
jgi:hypothetical protein